MNNPVEKLKKTIAGICLVVVIASPFLYFPATANAVGLGVPNDTSFDFNSIMSHMKDFTLDKLAVMIANQILQRMTASVVQWINTGFKGSPAFLTNPEAFFLDVGDQVTGELIAKSGALASLCTPFSLDVRLNIALAQATYNSTRYTCTLSKIITNSRNAIATAGQNSSINVNSAANGATLGNFINGDFKQGGWGGFIAYSTQTQNNPIGAALMANSDLQAMINSRQTSVNRDLNRGNGFLSWQDCKDVPVQGAVDYDPYAVAANGGNPVILKTAPTSAQAQQGNGIDYDPFAVPGASGVPLMPNYVPGSPSDNTGTGPANGFGPGYVPSGTAAPAAGTVKQCTTETPGSVIGGTLQRQLNVPTDKLVLVKTISDSINSILGALTNQLLSQGLAALSSKTSGHVGGNSYVHDLYVESNNSNSAEAKSIRAGAADSSSSLANLASSSLASYDRTIGLVNGSKLKYQGAQACFQSKLTVLQAQTPSATAVASLPQQITYLQTQIAAINSIFSVTIDPLIARLTLTRQSIQGQLDPFTASINSSTGNSTLASDEDYINKQMTKVDSAVSASAKATKTAVDAAAAAQLDATAVQKQTDEFNTDAAAYQTACTNFPASILGPTVGT